MTAGRHRRIRRNWRAAVVVFLGVFLGGLGVTGASALWSQQATVTANISTGTWVDYTRPDFSMPMHLTATKRPAGNTLLYRGVTLGWSPEGEVNPSVPVTYRVTTEAISRGPLGTILNSIHEDDQTYEGSATSRNIRVSIPGLTAEQWRVTITPIVNGVEGKPTVGTFSVDLLGNVTMP